MNIDAFEIDDIWRLRHNVGIEHQSPVLDPNPYATLVDAAPPTVLKACRVHFQWIDFAFLIDHFCAYRQDKREIMRRCLAQTNQRLKLLGGRLLLKQELATGASLCTSGLCKVVPEGRHVLLLAEDH